MSIKEGTQVYSRSISRNTPNEIINVGPEEVVIQDPFPVECRAQCGSLVMPARTIRGDEHFAYLPVQKLAV